MLSDSWVIFLIFSFHVNNLMNKKSRYEFSKSLYTE
ncbi:hypothetical protein SEML1_0045 [Candidatus Southlakia epibionticum]|uniref:Uncharacterized protein n=1 Tax=Candidatus Southlakia epibionticum TaxID=3043284 RepID=A0ABY8WT89_9BACT|nr:hypothetical protein SEML1_0045 [Candidatus Saccharimonadaceae bacterium ML1]